MSRLSKFETFVLSATADDYMLAADLLRTLKDDFEDATQEGVVAALRSLTAVGWVTVFWYDVPAVQYRETSMDAGRPLEQLYFMISTLGLEVLDASWDDSWLA